MNFVRVVQSARDWLSDLDPLWTRRVASTGGALLSSGGILLVSLRGGISEFELTSASILIALVFGLLAAAQNAFGERRRLTVELISAFSTSGPSC